ncbi:Fe-S cluster assembly protein SufD [Bradyrhizobium sp. LHD-71]|uniref:Fe-S cluster assembly protein SufD n=1 Tax=Bradyrhizobium sp. LHD-71 TaxID=3072141 RepID=UPI00280CF359|nr:Fe-S cluster assembly protein SufD [Bradyrhizobium sp. LHD-71]MDQ8731559.1 Fe-S cluster assembly protein SufD [Bradyrhizobium sp. LHD-71]
MDAVVKTSGTERALADQFAAALPRLPGGKAVAAMRTRALENFACDGLPHRRIEDWKYTDLRALMREVLPPAAAPDKAALDRAAKALERHGLEGVRRLVLVDGVFVPALSDVAALEGGLTIRSLASVLADETVHELLLSDDAGAGPMFALNSALMADGLVIDILKDASPARPLHIVHVASGSAPASAYTRSLVRIGANVSATLVESFFAADGAQNYQVNDATMIAVGDGARLDHVRLMEDGREAFNIATLKSVLGRDAAYKIFNLTAGGAVSRYQGVVRFDGQGSRLETYGVNLLNETQHGDTTLVVDHAVPHCASREVFRAVIDDRARSVFQGRIIVRPDAQKTDGKMETRALLLSDEAEVDNKPELEIFADDVTCGHGATAGALDESLLFYLRARGLPEKDAQALLIQAFVGEAIEQIADDRLREAATNAAIRWLEARAS